MGGRNGHVAELVGSIMQLFAPAIAIIGVGPGDVKQTIPETRLGVNLYVIAALLSLAAWVVLAFVLAVPSGWVNVPYAAGWVLLARGLAGTTFPKSGKSP
jgi:hypothetical protein